MIKLTRKQAAEYIRAQGYPITKATLSRMASVGTGPAYIVFGRNALYEPAALDTWVSARVRVPA